MSNLLQGGSAVELHNAFVQSIIEGLVEEMGWTMESIHINLSNPTRPICNIVDPTITREQAMEFFTKVQERAKGSVEVD
jgi:hypothetical protein